jgi:hypothetical protein
MPRESRKMHRYIRQIWSIPAVTEGTGLFTPNTDVLDAVDSFLPLEKEYGIPGEFIKSPEHFPVISPWLAISWLDKNLALPLSMD